MPARIGATGFGQFRHPVDLAEVRVALKVPWASNGDRQEQVFACEVFHDRARYVRVSARRLPQDRTCPYDPPTAYDPLREGRPLSRVSLYDGRSVWVVTGHAAARALLSDQRLSSDRTLPRFPATTERFEAVRTRRVALLGVDDPEHRTQRRMLVPSFTLKRAAALRPRIQETVDGLLDAMEAQGPPAELVSAFALPLPSMVICALLGVPYADHDFFESQSRRLLRAPGSPRSRTPVPNWTTTCTR